MVKNPKNWLSLPNITPTWAVLSVVFWTGLVCAIQQSQLGTYISTRVEQVLTYRFRQFLDLQPKISSKLRILALDDASFSALDSWVLSTQQWADLLTAVASKHPQMIVIDAMFSTVIGREDSQQAIQKIGAIKTPIVIGSFAVPQKIGYRQELDRDRYGMQLSISQPEIEKFPNFRSPQGFVYGPHRDFQNAFGKVGHFMYDGGNEIDPFLRIGDQTLLPHITLAAQPNLQLSNGRLSLDGVEVPLDNRSRIPVNFVEMSRFLAKSNRVINFLQNADPGKSGNIQEGDVVLILPQMYTGNTDFKWTPLGYMPAGLVLAALLNSILEHNFIRPAPLVPLMVLLCALVGAVLAFRLRELRFWIGISILLAAIIFAGLLLFATMNVLVPWAFCAFAAGITALTVFAEKTRVGERKVEFLRLTLAGTLPENELNSVLKNPQIVDLEPKERAVTVMFVDVVGFSMVAESMQPRVAFDRLKDILAKVSSIVHSHGGIVDKTLGDGLLAYFGYSFEKDTSSLIHAEQALHAAVEIQTENVKTMSSAGIDPSAPLFPLRIGINTTSCYIGDLGTSGKIDLTVVGNGVNFAKRLDAACEVNKVLMGRSTFSLITDAGFPQASLMQRWIQIKHHRMPVEAYQFDPFAAHPEDLQRANEAYRQAIRADRGERRWTLPAGLQISVHSHDLGTGSLINFSQSGVCGTFSRKPENGQVVRISIDESNDQLARQLKQHNICDVASEVCWAYEEEPGKFQVGLRFVELKTEDKGIFLNLMEEHVAASLPVHKEKVG